MGDTVSREAAGADFGGISISLEKALVLFSSYFLDMKHRKGLGGVRGEEPEVFQTNGSLFKCLP